MKRIGWLILVLTLSIPLLTCCCNRPDRAALDAFDALARWAPGDAEQTFFLDLEPDGETGRHWERIRRQLEANPTGQQALDGLFGQFSVGGYGLDEFVVRPAVNWYGHGTECVIAQVSDEEATRDALLQYNVTWEQEEYEGKILYHGRPHQASSRERLARTIRDGLLFLSIRYDQEALTGLQELLSLAQEDSLAALPAW